MPRTICLFFLLWPHISHCPCQLAHIQYTVQEHSTVVYCQQMSNRFSQSYVRLLITKMIKTQKTVANVTQSYFIMHAVAIQVTDTNLPQLKRSLWMWSSQCTIEQCTIIARGCLKPFTGYALLDCKPKLL